MADADTCTVVEALDNISTNVLMLRGDYVFRQTNKVRISIILVVVVAESGYSAVTITVL